MRIGWATLCCLAMLTSGAAAAAEKLPSGEYFDYYAQVDDWGIRRVASDEAGRKVLYCEATWVREGDFYLYLALDAGRKQFSYGIPVPIPSGRKQATMRVWFDGDKAHAAEVQAAYVNTPISGAGEDGYLVAVENGEASATLARLAKARTITFAYPFEVRTRVESFPYKRAAKALGKLADCADGR